MSRHIEVKQYLETVSNQIRYKRICTELCEEIENHIDDQAEAFEEQGFDKETAALKAVEQMGDPVTVGMELDRTHRPRPEWSVIVLTFLMLLAGIIIRVFTSPLENNGLELFSRQLIFMLVGTGLMAVCYYMDFTLIGKYHKTNFIILIVFAIVVLCFSKTVQGRHLYVSNLLLLFPAAFAGIVYGMRNKGHTGIILSGLLLSIPCVIALLAPNSATMLLLALSGVLVLTASVLKTWNRKNKLSTMLLIYLPPVSIMLAIVFTASEYLYRRLMLSITPSVDPMGPGYVTNITRQLLEGAKFTGQGAMPEKFAAKSISQILPGINSDFLLTYVIHRFGWLAFIIIASILAAFIIRVFILCAKQKNVLAFLVSTAIAATLSIQVMFYMLVNLGFQILSPLALPLISQSSAYLLIDMCLIGVLLSTFRTGNLIKDKGVSRKTVESSFLKFEDGKLIIDLKFYR